jgi:hypothetical protein
MTPKLRADVIDAKHNVVKARGHARVRQAPLPRAGRWPKVHVQKVTNVIALHQNSLPL